MSKFRQAVRVLRRLHRAMLTKPERALVHANRTARVRWMIRIAGVQRRTRCE